MTMSTRKYASSMVADLPGLHDLGSLRWSACQQILGLLASRRLTGLLHAGALPLCATAADGDAGFWG